MFLAAPLAAFDVTVAGTGITGLWTAYTLSNELEKAGLGNQVTLHIVSKVDWQEMLSHAKDQEIIDFSDETSGWGPVGLQLNSGITPWNMDGSKIELFKRSIGNLDSSYYISPEMDEEGKLFIEMFAGWHDNHLETNSKRPIAMEAVNRLASDLWKEFKDQIGSEEAAKIHLTFDGIATVVPDLSALEGSIKGYVEKQFPFETYKDSAKLAKRLPLYAETILEKNWQGLFLSGDGSVESNELRHYLWNALLEKRGGRPKVVFHLGSGIESFLPSSTGVRLEDGTDISSDLVVLAMGYGTKQLLQSKNVPLPLGKIWGSVLKASLQNEDSSLFTGGVSVRPLGLFALVPSGKYYISSYQHSFLLPSDTIPSPLLFKERLKEKVRTLAGNQLKEETIQFFVAPRVMTPDDLPIIDLEATLENVIVLLPTGHMGLTQSPALGKLATLHILKRLGQEVELPISLEAYRADRFKMEEVSFKIFQ